MTPTTLDNIAIGLALGAILMRLMDRPWWASLLSSTSLFASMLAQATATIRRRPSQASDRNPT